MVKAIKETSGLWLFITPVKGINISDDMDGEIKVDKITFISAKKIPRVRKRLGFPVKISEICSNLRFGFAEFLEESETYAICKLGGAGSEQEKRFLELVREELCFLALSQLSYSRRKNNAQLALVGEYKTGFVKWFMMNLGTQEKLSSSLRHGRVVELRIDSHWRDFHRYGFYLDLVKIIFDDSGLCELGWRNDLRRAAYTIGKSQMSMDVPQAFLLNVIALEVLLTSGDKILESLPERVEAFIGWSSDWSIENYSERIKSIYKKRCGFVHAGKTDEITINDLLFTDGVLVNVLYNIVKHIELFKNKKSIIDFSEKIQAEKLLGIRSKLRPKTFHFIKMHYSDEDFKRI